jgi:PleD family two-component response regulator
MHSMENLNVVGSNSTTEGTATGRSILIIDNGHRDRRRVRAGVLKDAGFRVHPARSFEQSLSRVGSASYDLIIASTDGAAEDALRFCQSVRQHFPKQKLLVLKASGAEVGSEFESVGADPKALLERAQALLQPSESHHEPIAA